MKLLTRGARPLSHGLRIRLGPEIGPVDAVTGLLRDLRAAARSSQHQLAIRRREHWCLCPSLQHDGRPSIGLGPRATMRGAPASHHVPRVAVIARLGALRLTARCRRTGSLSLAVAGPKPVEGAGRDDISCSTPGQAQSTDSSALPCRATVSDTLHGQQGCKDRRARHKPGGREKH